MKVVINSKTRRHGSDTTENDAVFIGYVLYNCITIMINLILLLLLLSTPTVIVSARLTTSSTISTPVQASSSLLGYNSTNDMITTNLMYGTSCICLQQLVQCSTDIECQLCYTKLAENEIDWSIAAVTAVETETATMNAIYCDNVLSLLHKNHYCLSIPTLPSTLRVPSKSKDYFCNVLLSCSSDDQNNNNNNNNNIHKELIPTPSSTSTSIINYSNTTTTIVNDWIAIDCNTLTECYWPGIQPKLLGNGKCNDITLYNDHTYGGCYNTKICNYDNGDCCPDTCNVSSIEIQQYSYKYKCGTIGEYSCRNPFSTVCTDGSSSMISNTDDYNNNDDRYENTTLLHEHVQCLDDRREDFFIYKTYQDVKNTWGDGSNVCEETTIEYIIRMKDSFGNGWDAGASLRIRKRDTNNTITSVQEQTINSLLQEDDQEQDMNNIDPSIVSDGSLAAGHDAYVQLCIPKPTVDDTNHYCFTVELRHTTMWGRYISWEIYPPPPSSSSVSLHDVLLPPPIAHGSGLSLPKVCQFSILNTDDSDTDSDIVQQNCPNTCTGSTTVTIDPSGVTVVPTTTTTTTTNNNDNENIVDEIQLKDMYKCIHKKCFIQVNECNKNSNCTKCFQSTIPTVDCYMIDTFTVLSDCTMCKCMPLDASTLQFCSTKVSTSTNKNTNTTSSSSSSSSSISTIPNTVCTSSMKQAGSVAIMTYTQQCITSISTMDILLRYYDEHHYGLLDTFLSCVQTYVHDNNNEDYNENDDTELFRYGSALVCVQILYNAITPHNNFIPTTTDRDDIIVSKQYPIIISEIAKHVYYEIDDIPNSGSNEQTTTTSTTASDKRDNKFCTCTDTVYHSMPVCPTFINFNKLLLLSTEVCSAMHQIECSAYIEFVLPCIHHLQKKFNFKSNYIDFSNSNSNTNNNNNNDLLNEQCTYIEESCGGSGFFPLNRSLYNCQYELHDTSIWYLYTNYSTYCRHRNYNRNNNSNINSNSYNNRISDTMTTSIGSNNDIHAALGGQKQQEAVVLTNQMEIKKEKPIYIPHEELGKNNGTKGGRLSFLFICIIITVISLTVVYKRRETIKYYLSNTNLSGSYRTVGGYEEDIRYNDTDTSRDWYLLQNRTTTLSSSMLNGNTRQMILNNNNDDENGIALSTSITASR